MVSAPSTYIGRLYNNARSRLKIKDMTIKFQISKKSNAPYAELSHSFAGYVVRTYDREALRMICASAGIDYDASLASAPCEYDVTASARRVKN